MRAGKIRVAKYLIQDFLKFPGDCKWFIAEMLKFPGDWRIESIQRDRQGDYEFVIAGSDFPEVVMGEIKECVLVIHRLQTSENEYRDSYEVKELK